MYIFKNERRKKIVFDLFTNGPFAYFPIKYIRDLPSHKCNKIGNSYGYLRSALAVIKTKYVTRYGGTFCDSTFDPVSPEYYDICPNETSMIDWHSCQKDAFHGPAHLIIGGSNHLYEGQPAVEESTELLCTSFACQACTI